MDYSGRSVFKKNFTAIIAVFLKKVRRTLFRVTVQFGHVNEHYVEIEFRSELFVANYFDTPFNRRNL